MHTFLKEIKIMGEKCSFCDREAVYKYTDCEGVTYLCRKHEEDFRRLAKQEADAALEFIADLLKEYSLEEVIEKLKNTGLSSRREKVDRS